MRPVTCLTMVLLILSAGCNGLVGGANEANPRTGQSAGFVSQTLLNPSATSVDLGVLPRAGLQRETISLSNLGATDVKIATIEKTCDCLHIEMAQNTVCPAENVLVHVKLDLSMEPNFEGELAMEAKGLTAEGRAAFLLKVTAKVKPKEEFGKLEVEERLHEFTLPSPKPMPQAK